jgi:RNA polymerase sigma factor (sigma-70 family)
MQSRPRPDAKTPDADLVALCAAGDVYAWRVLVTRYRRLIYTIPYRMGLDPAEADDVFQLAFARLAERIDRLERPERVRAWLVTTARRLSLNVVTRRRRLEDSAVVLENVADPSDLPGEEIERLEEQQLIRIALERLGGRCRELLSLLYYPEDTGASYETISKRLGMPIGSIGPTRMRCLRKLRAEFERLAGEDGP